MLCRGRVKQKDEHSGRTFQLRGEGESLILGAEIACNASQSDSKLRSLVSDLTTFQVLLLAMPAAQRKFLLEVTLAQSPQHDKPNLFVVGWGLIGPQFVKVLRAEKPYLLIPRT